MFYFKKNRVAQKITISLCCAVWLSACTMQDQVPLPTTLPASPAPTHPPMTTTHIGDAQYNLPARHDVQQFIQEMVTLHQYDAAYLNQLFAQVRLQPDIVRAMDRPAESKTWAEYRPIFISQKRINDGIAFWQTHQQDLLRAEQQYGVAAETIVAIIGVETGYGQNMGKWRVMDALATLAFEYPRRAPFFRKELVHVLLIARDQQIDPLTLKGSYAGAMGMPQFMPSSYRNWAVDFNGDGHKNLWTDPSDAIGSVAHYLAKNAWIRGGTVALPAQVSGHAYTPYLTPHRGVKAPSTSVAQLQQAGVQVAVLSPSTKGMLFQYEGAQGTEFWVGFQNFYAITRYNGSPSYALAVHQLGQLIKAQVVGN